MATGQSHVVEFTPRSERDETHCSSRDIDILVEAREVESTPSSPSRSARFGASNLRQPSGHHTTEQSVLASNVARVAIDGIPSPCRFEGSTCLNRSGKVLETQSSYTSQHVLSDGLDGVGTETTTANGSMPAGFATQSVDSPVQCRPKCVAPGSVVPWRSLSETVQSISRSPDLVKLVPRGMTWDCTSHYAGQGSIADSVPEQPPQAKGDDGVARIESELLLCEASLRELEEVAKSLTQRTVTRSSSARTMHHASATNAHDTGLELSRRFEELAADSLELGCSRIAGAMELFERSNAGLERMAACLHLCRQALEDENNGTVVEAAEGHDQAGASALAVPAASRADDWREDAASAVAKAFAIATAVSPPLPENSPCTGLP